MVILNIVGAYAYASLGLQIKCKYFFHFYGATLCVSAVFAVAHVQFAIKYSIFKQTSHRKPVTYSHCD